MLAVLTTLAPGFYRVGELYFLRYRAIKIGRAIPLRPFRGVRPMENVVTCPHCQFTFPMVYGIDADSATCPRCAQVFQVPLQVPRRNFATQEASRPYGGWGGTLIFFGMIGLTCGTPIMFFCEQFVQRPGLANLPNFSTGLAGVSSLALIAAGWLLFLERSRREKIVTAGQSLVSTGCLIGALGLAGYIFAFVICISKP
jgi:hypothetical protein